MSKADIHPHLFIADAEGAWDCWRWAVMVFQALRRSGGDGTLVLAGAPRVPACARGEAVFADEHLTEAVVGRLAQRAWAQGAAGEAGIVHAFGGRLAPVAEAMARRMGCGYFLSLMRYDGEEPRLRADDGLCAGVFVEDEESAARIRTLAPDATRVYVMPPAPAAPVPVASRGAEATGAGAAGRTLSIASFGTWGELSGMPRLLDAAARLREAGLSFEIFLQGAGPGEAEVRRLAATLNLTAATTFIDDEIDFTRIVEGTDIVVLAGDRRGATLPVVSAAALGKCAVVCDPGGIADLAGGARLLCAEPGAASVAEMIAALAGQAQARREGAPHCARSIEKSLSILLAAYGREDAGLE